MEANGKEKIIIKHDKLKETLYINLLKVVWIETGVTVATAASLHWSMSSLMYCITKAMLMLKLAQRSSQSQSLDAN